MWAPTGIDQGSHKGCPYAERPMLPGRPSRPPNPHRRVTAKSLGRGAPCGRPPASIRAATRAAPAPNDRRPSPPAGCPKGWRLLPGRPSRPPNPHRRVTAKSLGRGAPCGRPPASIRAATRAAPTPNDRCCRGGPRGRPTHAAASPRRVLVGAPLVGAHRHRSGQPQGLPLRRTTDAAGAALAAAQPTPPRHREESCPLWAPTGCPYAERPILPGRPSRPPNPHRRVTAKSLGRGAPCGRPTPAAESPPDVH